MASYSQPTGTATGSQRGVAGGWRRQSPQREVGVPDGGRGRRLESAGSVKSGGCEPMEGGETDSHGCNSSGGSSAKPWKGRRAIAQLEWPGEPHRTAERFGASRSVRSLENRAINGEGRSSHECYAFVVERSNGVSTEGPGSSLIGAKTSYIWRGKSRGFPCGAGE